MSIVLSQQHDEEEDEVQMKDLYFKHDALRSFKLRLNFDFTSTTLYHQPKII